jgi:esterase
MSTAAGHVHATEMGASGPRVAFLHGLFGQGKNWATIAKGLADSCRVLLIDLPNHGRSGWTDHFSYPEMADQIGELLAAGSADPVNLVGHSMGGKVAMLVALSRPQLVERLCVVDVSPVDYPSRSSFASYVTGMRSLDLDELPDRATADAALQPYERDPAIRSFLLQNLRRGKAPGDHPWRWRLNLGLLSDALDQVGGWPEVDAAPYEGPVLWVAGANSDYVRPEYAPRMRALFPRVRQVTVKNAGHWVHSEQPQVFTAILRRFLGL